MKKRIKNPFRKGWSQMGGGKPNRTAWGKLCFGNGNLTSNLLKIYLEFMRFSQQAGRMSSLLRDGKNE